MKNKSSFSRRKFLTLGSLSVAGFWAASTQVLGAHNIRSFVKDVSGSAALPGFVPEPKIWDSNAVTAAWLGHATVLINFYGLRILTDPVLYQRIGANTSFGTVGPRRLVRAPLKPSQLPPIDLVVISHAHMDHLDPSSLRSLSGQPTAVTAKATTDLLNGSSIRKAHALSWDEGVRVSTGHGEISVRAFEVRHWGARWRYDTHRGYNGYILEREGKRIVFGGDTAMCASFKSLRKHGPFDLAIMPIGAYHPWVHSHCNPEEAVAMANQAGSDYFLPIHFKTFPLGRERREEPLERLKEAIEPDRLALTDVGQTFFLPTS